MNPDSGDSTPLYDWDVAKLTTYKKYEKSCQNRPLSMIITYEDQKDFAADTRTKYTETGSKVTAFTNKDTKYYIKDTEPLSEGEWNKLPVTAWSSNTSKVAGSYEYQSYTEANTRYNKDFYIAVTGGGTNSQVSQTVTNIQDNEYYTLSGYINSLSKSSATLTITYALSNNKDITVPLWAEGTNTKAFNDSKWIRFEHTFQVPKFEDSADLTITFKADTPFALWHTKLEYGSIATAWSPAPGDTEDAVVNQQTQYDTYLSQDKIFDKLVTDDNGEKMVGIWLLPGEESASGHNELYINATYMSTGILRSNNFNGVLGKIKTSKKDAYGRSIYTYDIKKMPTQGVYFNLDEGKLWAANFELTAGDSLYLNSNPGINRPYLYVGNDNNYISFKRTDADGNTSLAITSNIFTLIAGSENKDIVINSQAADDGYPLSLGGGNFKVSWGGILNAKGALIEGTITGSEIYMPNKTSPKFSVTSAGVLSATGATLTTLTVKESLSVAKVGNNDGSLSVAGNTSISGNTTISGTSQLTGAVTIGTTTAKTSLTINGTNAITGATTIGGKLTIGTSATGADVDIYGNISLVGSGWLYLSNLGASGAKINAIGGKQLVLSATTGIWLQAESSGIQLETTGVVSLEGAHINLTGTNTYYTGYLLSMPTPSDVWLPGVNKTLQTYVEECAGVVKVKDKEIAMVARARALVNSAGTTTLGAPASVGSAGQILTTTDAAGTTSWATLGATLVNFTNTTTVEGPYTSGTNTYYKVKVDYDKSGSVTAPAQSGSVEVKYPGYWLCWDTDSTGGRITSSEYSAASYSESWVASRYKYYTYASSRTYTKSYTTEAQTVTYEASGTTEGQVQINVSLT